MRSRTLRLDEDIDPFAVGSASGLLWHHPDGTDPTLAGVGEACRIPIERPHGAEQAQRSLALLAGDANSAGSSNETGGLDGPGTGPVAFTSLPFDRSKAGELIVPEIVLAVGPHGRRWLTITDDGTLTQSEAVDRLHTVAHEASTNTGDPQPTRYEVVAQLPPEVWRDKIVGPATERLKAGELDKLVLARRVTVTADHPIDVPLVLSRLRGRFPTAILYSVDGYVGASPELLVGRYGDVVRAHPLAGTAPRSADLAVDGRLAAELFASDKNRWEHRITIEWLLNGLLPFCSYVDAEPEPSIVSLANVHHLGTKVEGRLSSPAPSVLELTAALHPTPAVGGDPQSTALAMIEELEQMERGRYAGPVGWVDGAGNGAMAVGIRSAEIDGNQAKVTAGNGIVADSDPVSELAETRHKFQVMLGALIQP